MLSARDIFRLLIEDEQPAPPDDPNQLALPFNTDLDDLDPKSEIMRYAEEPFRVAGDGPNSTYRQLKALFTGRVYTDEDGARFKRVPGVRNTAIYDYGDRIGLRYHETDVITAYPDGRTVINTKGWHLGGHRYSPWNGKPTSGETSKERINTYLLGTGWRIYRKDHVWYWYNSQSRKGDYNDDLRYPYSDGDVINADGSLSLKEHPVVIHKGRRRRPA